MQEIAQEQIARSVIGRGVIAIGPIIELQVRVDQVEFRKPAHVVAVEPDREFGEAFIDPGLFVAIEVPVDHVLKLVCQ